MNLGVQLLSEEPWDERPTVEREKADAGERWARLGCATSFLFVGVQEMQAQALVVVLRPWTRSAGQLFRDDGALELGSNRQGFEALYTRSHAATSARFGVEVRLLVRGGLGRKEVGLSWEAIRSTSADQVDERTAKMSRALLLCQERSSYIGPADAEGRKKRMDEGRKGMHRAG